MLIIYAKAIYVAQSFNQTIGTIIGTMVGQKTWSNSTPSILLMLCVSWQSLAIVGFWASGIAMIITNGIVEVHHSLQQRSRRRTRQALFALIALFGVVTDYKNFFTSNILRAIPQSMSSLSHCSNPLQYISNHPEMLRLFLYECQYTVFGHKALHL